jgi:ComF family protein
MNRASGGASVSTKPFFPTIRDHPPSRPRQLADAVLNLFYPDACFICYAPIARQQDCGLCLRCWERTQALQLVRPWCPSCGLPVSYPDTETAHLCGECVSSPPLFSGARSYGNYSGELSRIIQEFKFRGRRNLVRLLGPLMARAFFDSWDREQIDMLIPIPLHPKRRRERGFNQSELLARSLSTMLALPCCSQVIRRVRYTEPQVGLRDPERLRNVRGAFCCVRPDLAARKRLLLIDDVMTTGATARSATESLLSGGALRVSILTVARAVPG